MALTEQEITEKGSHLAQIHQVLCANAICLLGIAPEVAKHVGQDEAEAFARFAATTLKPVVEALDNQLSALREQYLAVHGEVSSLEDLLQQPAAEKPKPGAGGYL